MASTPVRNTTLSPFDSPTGRQSPFRRQNSVSPATTLRATPTSTPAKTAPSMSPTKMGSLSPEKSSPFARRPGQMNLTSNERPSSPLARPASTYGQPVSLSRRAQEHSQEELSSEDTMPSSAYASANESLRNSVSEQPEPQSFRPPSQANLRSAPQRMTPAPITNATRLPPPSFPASQPAAQTVRLAPSALPNTLPNRGGPNAASGSAAGAYTHISQPLLHSMRESFEVLDVNNTGGVTAAAIADMLSQLGLDATPAVLGGFFPANAPSSLNLARYLDILAGPLAELSPPEELRAAFEAFDLDDSGQIDVNTLREALLHAAPPPPGEDIIRFSEKDVDSILGEFSGRRAFGAKGINAGKNNGQVFRYRDFMSTVSGGSGSGIPEAENAIAA